MSKYTQAHRPFAITTPLGDGMDRNGGVRPQELKKIFPDSERTVKLRKEQEETASLEIRGASNCGQFAAGHTFNLERLLFRPFSSRSLSVCLRKRAPSSQR
jgi:hypothetical protein